MQDDGDTAPIPIVRPARGSVRPPGQPLGIYDPTQQQGQVTGQPTIYQGQTVRDMVPFAPPAPPVPPYVEPPTPLDPPMPQAWPGAASPYDTTVYRPQPSAPWPQANPQRGLVPYAPPRSPAPRASAPAPRVSRPRAASAPAPQPAQPGRWAQWVPLPHALLVVGVGLLALATLLPWAVDSSGALITLQSTSIPALSTQSGDGSAAQMAYNLIGAIGVLSLGLLFFNVVLTGLNRLLGGGCVAGCAMVPLYPILVALIALLALTQVLAAGFGGMGALGQLPVVQSYGLGGIGAAHYEPGYYVWYTGLILNVAGMLGEFVVWRR